MSRYQKAIVRKPGKSVINGITTVSIGKPDFDKALEQHHEYMKVLERCGLELTIMDTIEKFPDALFVEDCAVVTEKCAVITNLGAENRQGEEISVSQILERFYKNIALIKAPGTLEGGDVLKVENHFYIGLSRRTNREGAQQLMRILEDYGYTGSTVSLEKILHLKSNVAYLGDHNLVLSGELIKNPAFKEFNKICIDDDEKYAANCIRVNDFVIIPFGYKKSKTAIMQTGYKVIEIDVSEFKKIDGGLSCLSLRF